MSATVYTENWWIDLPAATAKGAKIAATRRGFDHVEFRAYYDAPLEFYVKRGGRWKQVEESEFTAHTTPTN